MRKNPPLGGTGQGLKAFYTWKQGKAGRRILGRKQKTIFF
jgi:hypothetical protein